MRMCVSPGHAFEVAVASGGEEEGDEDGEVVGGVDEGGAGYGAGTDADQGEDEGDAEEDEEGGPGVGELLGVEEDEEDAGEDGGEDERGGGEVGGDLPALVRGGGPGEGEPVVGDGEGGEKEAAEADLLGHGGEEGSEGGYQPDIGGGAEEVVHGEGLGDGDEGGDGLDGPAEDEADGDEFEGVAAGCGEVPLDAVGEGAQPEEREEEPGGDEGGDVGEALGCDEELRLHDGGNDLLRVVIARRVGEANEEGGEEEQQEPCEGDEEQGVADVGDAGGDTAAGGEGGWRSFDDDGLAAGLLGIERGGGICERSVRLRGGSGEFAW